MSFGYDLATQLVQVSQGELQFVYVGHSVFQLGLVADEPGWELGLQLGCDVQDKVRDLTFEVRIYNLK